MRSMKPFEVDHLLENFTSNVIIDCIILMKYNFNSFVQEPDEMTIQLVPLVVGFRVVLLQALGYTTTLVSIIVLGMCGSPLFIFSEKMRRNIPPLFHRYSTARAAAVKREKYELFSLEQRSDESIAIEEWIIRTRALSIILTESRLVVAVTNTLALFVTLFLLQNIPISEVYIALLFLALLPNVLGAALTSIVYFGKRLNIRDVDFAAVHLGWLFGLESIEETSTSREFPLKSDAKPQSISESDESSSYLGSPLQSVDEDEDDISFSMSFVSSRASSCKDDDSKSTYYNISMPSSGGDSCDKDVISRKSNGNTSDELSSSASPDICNMSISEDGNSEWGS